MELDKVIEFGDARQKIERDIANHQNAAETRASSEIITPHQRFGNLWEAIRVHSGVPDGEIFKGGITRRVYESDEDSLIELSITTFMGNVTDGRFQANTRRIEARWSAEGESIGVPEKIDERNVVFQPQAEWVLKTLDQLEMTVADIPRMRPPNIYGFIGFSSQVAEVVVVD